MRVAPGYILPTVLVISMFLAIAVTATFQDVSSRYRVLNSSVARVDEAIERVSCVELARLYLENEMKTQALSAYLRNNTRLPSNFAASAGYSCPNVRLVALTHTSAASNTSTASLSAQYGAGTSRTQRYLQIRVEDDMNQPGLNTNIAVTMSYAE